MNGTYYRLLDHTADLRVEITGRTPADLFANAARALADLLCDPVAVQPRCERRVTVQGEDWADLMVNWLRELLYLWNGEQQLWKEVEIEALAEKRLTARVCGEGFDPDRHPVRHDLKAVTYHGITAEPTAKGWRAEVIFDV